jgi:hypothetical protein
VVLDDGMRLTLTPDGALPAEARVLTDEGQVTEAGAA